MDNEDLTIASKSEIDAQRIRSYSKAIFYILFCRLIIPEKLLFILNTFLGAKPPLSIDPFIRPSVLDNGKIST